MSDRMERNLFKYIWSHSQAPADLDSVRRCPVDADLLPGLRHSEADRQRTDPGQGLRDAGRHPECAADRNRQSVRRRLADALRRLRTRSHERADRAQHGVPRLCRHQRHVQALHQHLQGPARRADAAAPALPAGRPRAEISLCPVPQGPQFRNRDDDQGRGRSAGRLHRRGLRDAGLPRSARRCRR